MCGIFGIIGPQADAGWVATTVMKMFEESIPRGKDSSGLAWMAQNEDEEGHHIRILKKAVQGDHFAYDDDLLKVLYEEMPKVLIGHVRKLSQGKADNNENNHPLLSEETGLALVHNGRVHDYMWRSTNDKNENPYILGDFQAEVDTEAILRLVDTMLFIPRNKDGTIDPEVVAATPKEEWGNAKVSTYKAIDDAIFNLAGKNTCALLDPDEPMAIYAWRVDNPLFIAYVPEHKAVVFASTEDILKKSLSSEETKYLFNFFPLEKVTKTTDYNGMVVKDELLVRIEWTGEEGEEFKFDYTTADPDGADFSLVSSEDRKVEASKDDEKVSVH